MDRIRIYIAGKLNDNNGADVFKNNHRMIIWSEKVRRMGFSVYVPGLDLLIGLVMGDMEYNDYFENSQPWLKSSEAMFLIPGWEDSNGTKNEIETAKKNRIPVFDNLDEMINHFKSIYGDLRGL